MTMPAGRSRAEAKWTLVIFGALLLIGSTTGIPGLSFADGGTDPSAPGLYIPCIIGGSLLLLLATFARILKADDLKVAAVLYLIFAQLGGFYLCWGTEWKGSIPPIYLVPFGVLDLFSLLSFVMSVVLDPSSLPINRNTVSKRTIIGGK